MSYFNFTLYRQVLVFAPKSTLFFYPGTTALITEVHVCEHMHKDACICVCAYVCMCVHASGGI